MKVADIMQRSVVTVSEETPIKEVGRLIFSLGKAGLPVVKDKKLVGIITEEDILKKLHPTVAEYMEDPVHAGNFTEMEKNLVTILNTPAKEIMSKNVISIDADTPLVKAQSVMAINKFSKLPIVNKNNELIGIVSQGDIFREIVKNEIPHIEKERYAGFIARHYDLMVNWQKRFANEFPVIFKIFKDNKVKNILDVGVWTGEYTVNIAKRGVKVLGLDNYQIMIDMSQEKREKLPQNIKKNVDFLLTDYSDFSQKIENKFDGAICMGNSLPYIPVNLNVLFKEVSKSLRDKNAIIILQILNFEKVLKSKNRLISFIIQKSQYDGTKEHLFMEFFDNPKGKTIMHHVVIFDSDGKNWIYKGTTSVPVQDIRRDEIEKGLKQNGFKKIIVAGNTGEYQGEFGKLSFDEPFDSQKSDFLNIVAVR